MGMFDYISDFEIKCPKCGQMVTGFQSKDGECLLRNISYKDVDNFHSFCSNCGLWLNINRKIEREILILNGEEINKGD